MFELYVYIGIFLLFIIITYVGLKLQAGSSIVLSLLIASIFTAVFYPGITVSGPQWWMIVEFLTTFVVVFYVTYKALGDVRY
ncbi:hypothetical protein pv_457 [Pithovirus sibericum]|uniref:Transmembrane protein n=1 Tax=Pithovirus sibericum TaxID=1450746 RepID=W5S5H1_9VIRU|nr:hypothetical protein pv_457 [Pithovirus sibericum]AHH02023.1 hypothetical protein pv_457 [Pithovirus sibericum]